MKTNLLALVTFSLLARPGYAHRLDEYLQAVIVSIQQNEIDASMRLIPGVAIADSIISAIDSNSDGVFSQTEQQTYARRVLRDVFLPATIRASKACAAGPKKR